MSILLKPYQLSIWEEKLDENGELVENRLAIIGSHQMQAQCRAIEPNLVRNVNGSKQLTFKMYKKYIDNITGQEVQNPFFDWLINERKVKLNYDGSWHDFIIKDIQETSSNYLYTYSLEDAFVQELSKNGFGVTLDPKLMNNIGSIEELGSQVLEETDWNVESEVLVEKIKESLVYLVMPQNLDALKIYRVRDQRPPYTSGAVEELMTNEEKSQLSGKTILAFYSSCKNKPHRFQFIYVAYQGSELSYDKNVDGTYKTKRKDDRLITETDCQYFIEYDQPDLIYAKTGDSSLNLLLPNGFNIASTTGRRKDSLQQIIEQDSVLSTWYQGERYSYAAQSIYVPVLERYCTKYTKKTQPQISVETFSNLSGTDFSNMQYDNDTKTFSCEGNVTGQYAGIKIDIDYNSADTYVVEYDLEVVSGSLKNIGGHKASFDVYMEIEINGNGYNQNTTDDYFGFYTDLVPGDEIKVRAKYNKLVAEISDSVPYICIQPNRGLTDSVGVAITNLKVTIKQGYLGFVDSTFITPTLINNCITSYNLESKAGWSASANSESNNKNKATVENICGYFNGTSFVTLEQDVTKGEYSDTKTYIPYMKIKFSNSGQFILNSGIRDNRTLIKEMSAGDQWVLDCEVFSADGGELYGEDCPFSFTLGEYIYNTSSGIYNALNNQITFNAVTVPAALQPSEDEKFSRFLFEVSNTSYTSATFKKNARVYLKIAPKNTNGVDRNFYIKAISLYKKVLKEDNTLITPSSNSNFTSGNSIQSFIDQGVLENRYKYFSDWLVDPNNLNAIVDKDSLPAHNMDHLTYTEFVPVYNHQAQKINAVSAKESNYFNILQSICETFGAWLEIDVQRDEETGEIDSKTIKFKNYVGNDNYAGFRYGVNLKDITRTNNSKNIVTKLIVKQNANEHANNGFCTIQRANSNPTGENYIYDFQYYHNKGLMDINEYLDTVYYLNGAQGSDYELWDGEFGAGTFTLNGYFLRVQKINKALVSANDSIAGLTIELNNKKASLTVAEATFEASSIGVEEAQNLLYELTSQSNLTTIFNNTELMKRSDVKKYRDQYMTNKLKNDSSTREKNSLNSEIAILEEDLNTLESRRKVLLDYKKALNQLFFEKYSRFIQEGTWINEEYVDDEKYFVDAQSVLYQSCYPQVSYTINVISLSGLSGYEKYDFSVGDKTFIEDAEFFGENNREEVTITQTSETLDDPSKNTIKVQNFKNQFQDLFQKITATVQQAQYNSGVYERGAALMDANTRRRSEFITNALNGAQSYLQHGQTVTTGPDGITITDDSNKQNQLRLVGGAILFKTIDEQTQEPVWSTGITSEGVSASLITSGRLDTGAIQIMSGNEPTFKWDAFGISAYQAVWSQVEGSPTITGINTKKMVRFDKCGIYGIDKSTDTSFDGASWHPTGVGYENDPLKEIDATATFALTWEGLKVSGNNGVIARIGKKGNFIMEVLNSEQQQTFYIKNDGSVFVSGRLDVAVGANIGGWTVGEKSLITKDTTLGGSGSFHMYSSGTTSSASFGGSGAKTNWRLGIGTNFGVDSSGNLYAAGGKIGGCSITNGVLQISTANITNLSSYNFSANNITSGTIDASKVSVTNLNASNITSGTISASRINAENLATEKLSGASSTYHFRSIMSGGDFKLQSKNDKGEWVWRGGLHLHRSGSDYADGNLVLVTANGARLYTSTGNAQGGSKCLNGTILVCTDAWGHYVELTITNGMITGCSYKTGGSNYNGSNPLS